MNINGLLLSLILVFVLSKGTNYLSMVLVILLIPMILYNILTLRVFNGKNKVSIAMAKSAIKNKTIEKKTIGYFPKYKFLIFRVFIFNEGICIVPIFGGYPFCIHKSDISDEKPDNRKRIIYHKTRGVISPFIVIYK